ncbi:glutamate racemase [Acidocella sp.]|uniref:glutamate racemase n=1 Tax=Acidocella sp. TaxID=50710 RepID=UPI003CFDB7AA
MAILVFDSGIGGLGVVAALNRLAPGLPLTYLADNGFFPYGEKPDELLLRHITEVIGAAIARERPEAVVIACNTASTIALTALRATFALPFIGCVPPIKPAAASSASRTIGVLATKATVRRPYLNGLIERFAPDCQVLSLGTPALAELAEQKFRGADVDVSAAVAPLFRQEGGRRIDSIALGCTHYTFLLPEFLTLRPDISWHDPALPVARQTLKIIAPLHLTPAERAARFTGAPVAAELLAPFALEPRLNHPA